MGIAYKNRGFFKREAKYSFLAIDHLKILVFKNRLYYFIFLALLLPKMTIIFRKTRYFETAKC